MEPPPLMSWETVPPRVNQGTRDIAPIGRMRLDSGIHSRVDDRGVSNEGEQEAVR